MSETIKTIDGPLLADMTKAALRWLQSNKEEVNSLNVFPIPDGDTGINMVLTMQAGCDKLNQPVSKSVSEVSSQLANGTLMGGRGNSGIILSQIWRGISNSLAGLDEFDPNQFAVALVQASECAYRNVVKPVEGTILTVMKDASKAATHATKDGVDIVKLLQQVVLSCEQSVQATPDLLPILKQAGKVDAGGYGLQLMFEGMLRHLCGHPVDISPDRKFQPLDTTNIENILEAVDSSQEWEVVVDLQPYEESILDIFYGKLESIGTSIQIGEGDEVLRVHIHLPKDKRFEPITLAEDVGTVVNVHMENLIHQISPFLPGETRSTDNFSSGQILATIVSAGPGFSKIFSENPAVVVVPGGQTMNSSTEELLDSFESLPVEQVIILPNNPNIILAAEQASKLSKKEVSIIPTRSIPQGIAAMLAFNPDGPFDKICDAMLINSQEVRTGEITTATHSTTWNNHKISKGEIIGLQDNELICVANSPSECTQQLLRTMVKDDCELITLYYGTDISTEEANALSLDVKSEFSDLEVEAYSGGQPLYHYIISVE
jgi:DAK2 domain fusion protein YloV